MNQAEIRKLQEGRFEKELAEVLARHGYDADHATPAIVLAQYVRITLMAYGIALAGKYSGERI